jgi:hypothetical protein
MPRSESETATRRRYRRGRFTGNGHRAFAPADPRVADADVAARLAEIPPDRRSVSAQIMGDPVFERSALARRQSA